MPNLVVLYNKLFYKSGWHHQFTWFKDVLPFVEWGAWQWVLFCTDCGQAGMYVGIFKYAVFKDALNCAHTYTHLSTWKRLQYQYYLFKSFGYIFPILVNMCWRNIQDNQVGPKCVLHGEGKRTLWFYFYHHGFFSV